MIYIFWCCWVAEMIAAVVWITSELKLQYVSPNPFAFISAAWLLFVLAVFFFTTRHTAALLMVIIPAIPLLGLLLLVMIYKLAGGRYN